jgi:hypothetical protein
MEAMSEEEIQEQAATVYRDSVKERVRWLAG